MELVIAEKPSVARDLARVLGVRGGGEWLENERFAITWCVGHLVELDEPASYNEAWKAWRLDRLPMLPEEFRLRPSKHARDQLKTVTKLLKDKRFTGVINACDAGREGELIFRYVYQYAKSKLPVRRLWISSLTDDSIKRGFAGLRPGADYDALAAAAYSRSEADWLVGMNATRAVTTRSRTGYQDGTLFSIGRVQTPTLALLVRREDEIQAFVPRPYWEVRGDFKTDTCAGFQASWRHGKLPRLATEGLADAVVARDRAHYAPTDPAGPRVVGLTAKTVREPAPQLFDLTTLQRTANRRFGFSAARTLEIAQALYERHKVVTYPRTDSRHLSTDVAKGLPQLFEQLTALDVYAPFARKLVANPPRPSARIVDDAKVSDHHAIIPTGTVPRSLDRDEARLFDLIARRFLGAFYPDAEIAVTEAWIRVGAGDEPPPPIERADRDTFVDALPPPPDHFLARGRVRMVAGWQEVAGIDGEKAAPRRESRDGRDDDRDDDATGALPPLVVGQRLAGAFSSIAKQTTPPSRHTESTLLAAMESAGKHIEDEALRAAMKDVGLGTPATRAAIIETLLRRRYVDRDKQYLVPTPTGIGLIRALVAVKVASLASPELTGSWEARLARVARGEESRASFMADIARYIVETIDAIRGSSGSAMPPPPMPIPPAPATPQAGRGRGRGKGGARSSGAGRSNGGATASAPRGSAGAAPAPDAVCPQCKQGTVIAGNRGWGCSRWREGCRFVASSPPTVAASAPAPAPKVHDKPAKKPRAPKATKPVACPLCTQGTVIQGNRGWGCSRWREGCRYSSTTPPVAVKKPRESSAVTVVTKPREPSAVAAATKPREPSAVAAAKKPRESSAVAAAKKPRDSSVGNAAKPRVPAVETKTVTCPACDEGTVVAGNRGWGCSRWREGCRFVVWYERASKDLSPSQLQAAIASQPG